jgi:hypothetical protein
MQQPADRGNKRQTRGKQEVEVLADKRQQRDKSASMDAARLAGSGQQ